MPLLYMRALAPYQQGANATDVIINEVHFNKTALDHYNYTLYSNGTLSNGTKCYLAFDHWKPVMTAHNGSFVNGTSCYSPVHDIGTHASLGLWFAAMFAVSILFSGLNLCKHGKQYLPADRRWNPMSRRLKWYWLLFVAVCATISCIMSVDVDRDFLQHTPLLLQSIFYTLLMPGCMACVWEAVRHWGSYQERQILDRDPYAFTNTSTISTRRFQERLLPVVFYACALATLLLTIPRSWSDVTFQHSPSLSTTLAQPLATDSRFRAAGFTALAGLLVTVYSLEHSIYQYQYRYCSYKQQQQQKGHSPKTQFLAAAPSQFIVAILILAVKIIYAIASAFEWDLSPLKYDVKSGWMYGLGYLPALLLIMLFNICGACEVNEDKALIAMREERKLGLDNESGSRKMKRRFSAWWRSDLLRAAAREREVEDASGRVGSFGSEETYVDEENKDKNTTLDVEMGEIEPGRDGARDRSDSDTTSRTFCQGSSGTSSMQGWTSSRERE